MKVPPDEAFQLNDEIQFSWEGYSTNNGSGLPIEHTDFFATVFLDTPERVANGVLVTVLPWDTKIEPMRNYASALARYVLLRNGVPFGKSTDRLLRIDRTSAGSGKVCNAGDEGFCDEP